jgi:hypothetical protein
VKKKITVNSRVVRAKKNVVLPGLHQVHRLQMNVKPNTFGEFRGNIGRLKLPFSKNYDHHPKKKKKRTTFSQEMRLKIPLSWILKLSNNKQGHRASALNIFVK